ncbi:MAG: thioester reductase domain-containing protein [Pseudomonadota bacterium]|nr:thioester reductase domain-containing protein [Pseudomonadota bacterium]
MSTLISTARDSVAGFRDWLHHELSKSSDVGYTRIDFGMSLADLGISSVHVVRLCGELEKVLEIELEATLLYEFPTLDAMCETLLRMRANRVARASSEQRLPIHVAATFTAEPLEEAMRYLLGQIGHDPEIRFARYNNVFQELMSPGSSFDLATAGVHVVLFRIEDWFRYGVDVGLEAIERTVDEFREVLAAFLAKSRLPLVLVPAPHSPGAVRRLQLSEHLNALTARILDDAHRLPGVHVLDLRHVEEQFPVQRVLDEARDRLGHIPYTPTAYAAIGTAVARRVAAVLTPPAKVIVADCDNTLWGGVVGEDGPNGVRVDGPYAALQSFLVEQQRAGKLVCLCSKNEEADVWRVFDAHPEMPLRREHVVAWRVNWERKSENLRALAEELGLGLDSFVFLDDSAMECAEVRHALPGVLAVQLPEDPARIPSFLAHHWAFDTALVTDEDRRRTEMYQQNQERTALAAEALASGEGGFEAFLARLELAVDIAPVAADEWPRAAQLTHRTNQFNANRRVCTEAELQALLDRPGRVLSRVRVKDRFGDYGLVGLVACAPDGGTMVCDTFLLSCRVLGRRVEHAMVRAVADAARAAGRDEVVLRFTQAARNQVAQGFYEGLGMCPVSETEGEVRFAVADAETLLATAGLAGGREPREAASESVATPVVSSRARAGEGYATIAALGTDLDALQAAVAQSSRIHRPDLATEYVTPRSSWEKKIVSIWREVLRIDRVGVDDNFFELGGDSIRAAEAFARMWDLGVPESVSLQTIPEPTVASLAHAIEEVKAGRAPTLLADQFRLADEGRLADDIRHEGYDVRSYDRPMRSVLLTGATGYIGVYVLAELMQQTDARVICLVRAATPEDGRQRIVAHLRRYDLLDGVDLDRVDIVLGDLLEDRFGFSPAQFAALAARIDTIVHAACWVNFVYPYHHLKPTNVDSTETVLRLAIADLPNPIQVHFVSTLGVVMSTGYARDGLVRETDPLLHADDLLNGYEQTKYASDKMVWTAFTERGIPGAIYRPGMVGGLSSGHYTKLDEFLPQMLKGCIQLGSWPMLDTLWEMAPIDFVSKAIVHIATRPTNLNRAYFVLHPSSVAVAAIIEWHRSQGYRMRALPWAVWKREFLNLGTERLRKNALFPFVDFIRGLSEEQIFFPPTEKTAFHAAIADMPHEQVPALELLARYTRYFIRCGYYENLPSGPQSRPAYGLRAQAAPATNIGDVVDDRVRFDKETVNATEAYYVLWTDPVHQRSMVVRYVIHNGPIEEARIAEVWAWFRDRARSEYDVAIRQRYPVGRAEPLNEPDVRLRIGPSGYSDSRTWGRVTGPNGTVEWDFDMDKSSGVGVERVVGMEAYELYPSFRSNGVRHRLSGHVTVNGERYEIRDQIASDGHYWNTRHLKAWSWAHCGEFEGDPEFLVEAIASRFNQWSQPTTWATFVYRGQMYRTNLVEALYYNRETHADLTSWTFQAERGTLRFVVRVRANPEDQTLIVHPLPDDEYLYTHITYNGDMEVDIERKEGGRWWKAETRVARGTASFEVTRMERNRDVRREFRIVRSK